MSLPLSSHLTVCPSPHPVPGEPANSRVSIHSGRQAGWRLSQRHLGTSLPLRDAGQEGAGKVRSRELWGAGGRQRRQRLASCPGLSPSTAHVTPCLPCYFWSHPLIPSALLRGQCPNPVPPGPEKPASLTDPSSPPPNRGDQGLGQGPAGSPLKVSFGHRGDLPTFEPPGLQPWGLQVGRGATASVNIF